MDALFDAIEAGDVAKVSTILASEPGLANTVDRRTSEPPGMSTENLKLIGEDRSDGGTEARTKRPAWTALHIAVLRRHVDVARVLIEHGANLNAMDFMARSPLHLALLPYGAISLNLLELLLSSGADSNARDDSGSPPLDHAIFMHDAAAIDVLIRFGGDSRLQRQRPQVPLHFWDTSPNYIGELQRLPGVRAVNKGEGQYPEDL